MAVYQFMLERHYNIQIADSTLVILHPSNLEAIEILVPNIQDRLQAFLPQCHRLFCGEKS